MANDVLVHDSVEEKYGEWTLCFQKVTFTFTDPPRKSEDGFRFIWRRPDRTLQAARGQARIPAEVDLFKLLRKAADEGWFDLTSAAEILNR